MLLKSAGKVILLFLCGFLLVPLAASEEYRVTLDAPPELADSLVRRLEIFRWKKDPGINPVFFNSLYQVAPEQIRAALRSAGYYNPVITSDFSVSEDFYAAHFRVDPGPPLTVKNLEIRITGAIVDAPAICGTDILALKKTWMLPEGDRFSQEKWETAKRRFLRNFLAGCYPAAKTTDSRVLIDPENNSAEILFEINSGPPFTLGELNISGLERYPEELIHNLNFIRPGSPHSQARLLELQNRIQQSGYFEYVAVRIEVDPGSPAEVPIEVTVQENKRREIRMGIMGSSNTGAGAKFEYSDINLRRRGLKMRNTLEANRVERMFLSDLQTPARPNGTYDNYNFTASEADLRNEELNLLRFGFARTRPMGTFIRVFRIQYSRETTSLPEEEETQSLRSLTPIVSWNARQTDHLLYPSKGYMLDIRTAGALEGVFADAGFLHLNVKNRNYVKITPRNTIILRGEAGHVFSDSRQGIPSEFLFRTGGADTIRGYGFRSIGVEESGAIVGGRYLLSGSIELNRNLGDRWTAALFIDGGSAHDDWSAFDPVFGYGAGARIKTAAGPLNFDVAYGERTKQYKFHFTMGIVF